MNERDETFGRDAQNRYGTYRWGQRPPRGDRPQWRHERPAWNERARWREGFPRDQYGREHSSEQLFEPENRGPFGPGEDTHYYGTGAAGRGGPGFTGGAYGWGNGPRDPRRLIEDEFSDESTVSYEHAGHRGAPEQQQRYPRGPKGYQRSDERIREDICERLMGAYHIDSSEVTVGVKNGKVLLEGSVPSRHMKHAIEDIVDSCLGVMDIENHVRVGNAASPPVTSPAGR